jgi:hypothetical protein
VNQIKNVSMQSNEANIEIIRVDGKLISISVVMPMWDKVGMDETFKINIPLFGIKTFAKNNISDVDIAVEEAVKIFCNNAEKFGAGLENELRILGWSYNGSIDNKISMVYNVSENDIVMEQIMETGEQYAHTHNLELV